MLEIPIKKGKVGNCIWVEKELFDSLFILKLATKKGAWIEIDRIVSDWLEETNKPIRERNKQIDIENTKNGTQIPLEPEYELKMKHQGISQFSKYFEENRRVCEWLVDKIRVLHS